MDKSLTGIASLINEVPGVFIDGSLGEVYSRVYTRGISASAEDDIGWFYQSLQEDGLPMTAIQYNYFTPDFFQRSDLMTERLEAMRGGKSGILFQNAALKIVKKNIGYSHLFCLNLLKIFEYIFGFFNIPFYLIMLVF